MLSKFLDPKNDYAFHRVFGIDKNKDILIHFLNDMMVLEQDHHIEDLVYLKPNLSPEIASQKTSFLPTRSIFDQKTYDCVC